MLTDLLYYYEPIQHMGMAVLPQFYRDRSFQVSSGSIAQYWPLDETSGTTAFDIAGSGYNGTYTNTYTLGSTGLGDGSVATLFNLGRANIYSSTLASGWNGNELTLSAFANVLSGEVWIDGVSRYILNFQVDGSNLVYIRKPNSPISSIVFAHVGGGTANTITATISGLGYIHVALSLSRSNNRMRAFINGRQVGTTVTSLGNFAGLLGANLTNLGSASNSTSNNGWKGNITLVRHDTLELTPYDIARIALCSGFIVFDGDSRMIGTGVPVPQATTSGIADLRYGFVNLGVSGQTALQAYQDFYTQATPYISTWSNVAVLWAGINDAHAGFGAQELYYRIMSWAREARRSGYKVIVCTEIDANSALSQSVGWRDIYPALNILLRNNYTDFADALADLGSDSRLQNADDTTYYNADQVHLTSVGYQVAGSIIAAAVRTLHA